MNKHHHIYALEFKAGDQDIVFYVGHTTDLERRANEHQVNSENPKHAEYDTEKYQWCRSLRRQGLEFELVPLQLYASTDEDSEYEWILRQARQNVLAKISFYNGHPLCNMKGGDFIWEMMADKAIKSAKDIKEFRLNKQKIDREHRSYIRDFAGTRSAPEQAQNIVDWLKRDGERRSKLADDEAKLKQSRQGKYNTMLNDPERIAKIRIETERMMNDSKKETHS
jgi:hypothetical protein